MAPVAALDIGCSKITCLIAHNDPRHPRRVKLWGSGRATSRGFGPSGITDMGGLERAIRRAPEQYFWVHRRWKSQPGDNSESRRERKREAA